MKKLQKRLNDTFHSKQGVVSIYVVLSLATLLPMFLFLSIEFPYITNNHRRLKNNIDNAGSSAVLCLDESELSQGRIIIDELCAKITAYKILAANYRLDPVTLTPLEGSPLTKTPFISIRVVNNPNGMQMIRMPEQSMSDEKKFQDIYLEQTAVVIYVEMEFESLFFKSYHPTIRQLGSAQSTFGSS